MTLDEIISAMDTDALISAISQEPVYESRMLKAAFNDISIIGMSAVELYRYHFALFHKLYSMQNQMVADGRYLYVHFMRTGIFDYPEKGLCTYFSKDDMSFCSLPATDGSCHCSLHTEQLGDDALESLSVKYFYLDRSNYDKLDSVTAESLLSGAWEVLSSERTLDDAYRTLGLHGFENLQTVKIRFREMCRKYHPDTGGDKDKFMDVNRSYRQICKWLEDASHLSSQ